MPWPRRGRWSSSRSSTSTSSRPRPRWGTSPASCPGTAGRSRARTRRVPAPCRSRRRRRSRSSSTFRPASSRSPRATARTAWNSATTSRRRHSCSRSWSPRTAPPPPRTEPRRALLQPRPPRVFVHGFTCDHTAWRFQVSHFQTQRQVVACDLRGHGSTPGGPEDCTIGHYGGDVAALLGKLDFAKSILVGHSMGCRVVLEAARLEPGRVGAIVLIDGGRRLSADPARGVVYADFADALFSQMFLRPSAQSQAIIARAKSMPAETAMAAWLSMVRWDAEHMEAALAAVRAPLTAIQSTTINAEGKRVPLKAGEAPAWFDLIRQHVPAARLEIVPDSGHFTQLEAAASVNRLIGEACRSAVAP